MDACKTLGVWWQITPSERLEITRRAQERAWHRAREIEKAAQQADTVQEQVGGDEDVETLARLMEMLEGLSEADVKERIEEKTGSSLERITP